MLWREPVITWDGTVLPCCVDLNGDKPLGNIHDKPFSQIWNGPEITEMRRLHAQGRYREIDICRNCTIFQVKRQFALGSLFLDELSIRKVSPVIEKLDTLRGFKRASYFE
jgi:radical SAM protein with 4Fe4S-binding SPASM domain